MHAQLNLPGVLTAGAVLWVSMFFLVKVVDIALSGKINAIFSECKIVLHPGMISFSTTRYNIAIETTSKRYRSFLVRWFGIGVLTGFAGLFLSVLLLVGNLLLAVTDDFNLGIRSPVSHFPNGPAVIWMGHSHKNEARPAVIKNFMVKERGSISDTENHVEFAQTSRISSTMKNLAVAAPRPQAIVRGNAEDERRPMYEGAEEKVGPENLQGKNVPRHSSRGVLVKQMEGRFGRAILAQIARPQLLPPENAVRNEASLDLMQRNMQASGADADRATKVNRRIVGESLEQISESVGMSNERALHDTAFDKDESIDSSVFGSLQDSSAHEHTASLHRSGALDNVPGRRHGDLASHSHDRAYDDSTDLGLDTPKRARLASLSSSNPFLLTPLLPGVTVPLVDMLYIVLAILVSAVVHELGHGFAACVQEAKVSSVGAFLAFVFPGAYVKIAGVKSLSPMRQLRVYCAGAWHNIVLSIACLLFLWLLPSMLFPLYVRGQGALIVSVQSRSPLSDHVHPGDVLKGFGRFAVQNGGLSYRNAIRGLSSTANSSGFCVSEDMYRRYALAPSKCCRHFRDPHGSQRLQCFVVPGLNRTDDRYACMDASFSVTLPTCGDTSDCLAPKSWTHAHRNRSTDADMHGDDKDDVHGSWNRHGTASMAANELHSGRDASTLSHRHENIRDQVYPSERSVAPVERCIKPVLPRRQRLVVIHVRSASTGMINHFLYQGYPERLGESFSVSSYLPRLWHILPLRVNRVLAKLDIPNVLERQLQYTCSISLALAIFNMAPVYYLDGEASLALFLKLLMPHLARYQADKVCNRLLLMGTALAVMNVLLILI